MEPETIRNRLPKQYDMRTTSGMHDFRTPRAMERLTVSVVGSRECKRPRTLGQAITRELHAMFLRFSESDVGEEDKEE